MNLRRIMLTLAGLVLFGIAKLPFEHRLNREFHDANFLQGSLTHDVRKQAGQMGFVAALSGFRSVVGDIVWLQAYTAWTETRWGDLKFLLDASTSLEPRNILFWDMSSWHMAWNASAAALREESQPREALRIKASREYVRIGEDYLMRGIEFNPESGQLYQRLAELYRMRMEDHCKAAWAYYEAAARPGSMDYVHRFAVYELAECPGHEEEALKQLRGLYYEGPQERLLTLLSLIDQLQKQLNVPPAERIDVTKDMEEATPRHREAAPPAATPALQPPN